MLLSLAVTYSFSLRNYSAAHRAVLCRSFLLLVALALCTSRALAQGGWQQAMRLPAGTDSNNGYSEGRRTATDAAGNVYVVGNFYGTVSFGSTTLTSTGPNQERDFFVAKLSAGGQWLWAVQGGGAGSDQANDVVLDAAGNPYITGGIGQSATLGPFTLTSSAGGFGNDNMFVARLTTAGQFLWATKSGGRTGQSLALDAAGNVLVAGTYSSGAAVIGSTTLASYGNVDVFVAKLDPTGTIWLWAVRGGGTSNDYVTQIGTDAAGNAYITGDYGTNFRVDFGPFTIINGNGYVAKISATGQFVYAAKMSDGSTLLPKGLVVDAAGNAFVTGSFRSSTLTLGSVVLTGNGNTDGFIARIGTTGTWQWGTRFGGTSEDSGQGVALDAQGNLYATGSFTSTNVAFGNTTLSATGIIEKEVYLARLNAANGQWVWATAAGGILDDEGMGLSVGAAGVVNLVGNFNSPNAPFGSTTLSSAAYLITDTFVAQANGTTGAWNWAVSTEGGGDRRVMGSCTDAQGNLYLTGTFTGVVDFGSIRLNAEPNGNDIFVAKLGPNGQWLWAAQAGGGATDRGQAVAADAQGNVYVTGTFAAGSFAIAVPAFTAIFGSTTITTNGATDAFIAKLDSNGQWQWAVAGGGTGSDAGNGIGVNAAGEPFVTGTYSGARPVFGPTTLPVTPTQGGTFVSHLGTTGQWLWTVRAGSSGSDTGRALAVDAAGDPIITGAFNGTGAFGSTSLVSAGSSDVYVAKLNGTSGTFAWAARAGGAGTDEAYALALDVAGNPVLTGIMGSRTGIFGATTIAGSTFANLFVTKLTAAGQFSWAVAGSCTDIAEGAAVAVDARGAVYVAGQFQGVLTLGASILTNTPNASFTYRDLFVARLSAGGTWEQAVQPTGGTTAEYATSVAVGAGGQLYVAGYTYSRSLNFGASTIGSYNNYPTGFLAQPARLFTATRAGVGNPRLVAQLFPNPMAGSVPVLRLASTGSNEPVELIVRDVLGRSHLRRLLAAADAEVRLPEALTWPVGIYLLSLRQGTTWQTVQLVRE